MKPTPFSFTKMHALGNDFVVMLAPEQGVMPEQVIRMSDRHRGIGFDQLLVVQAAKETDFFCQIYNTDGSEAEQCGNGLRCVARFLHEKGLAKSRHFRIATKAGVFPLEIVDYDHVTITMGVPDIQASLVNLAFTSGENPLIQPISIINLGNPHALLKVESVDHAPVAEWGKLIGAHAHFPRGANVGFMQVKDKSHIRLRTFERGVGETHACGSNACAAAVAGIVNGWLQERVQVDFRYGSLVINWQGPGNPLSMMGPASRVFVGEIIL